MRYLYAINLICFGVGDKYGLIGNHMQNLSIFYPLGVILQPIEVGSLLSLTLLSSVLITGTNMINLD